MLSNNTFLENRIQRVLDGLIFVEKGLGVHVQRMLKMRKDLYTGGNFMGLFSNFLYTFTINCVTTGARIMPIEYMFCFICSEQCIKSSSSRKNFGLFSSVFKKKYS